MLFYVLAVDALHDHSELVPAYAEHRAVLELFADHLARVTNVFVAGDVPLRVVHGLQSVNVEDRHGKGFRLAVFNRLVDLAFQVDIGVLVF